MPLFEPNRSPFSDVSTIRMYEGKTPLGQTVALPSPDGIVMQQRAGTWFELEGVDSASIVKPAEMIAGPLVRSKGFFSVGEHLVSSADATWSLGPQGGQALFRA